ncbi:MAG: hypothetical protein ACYTG3_16460 [Planctomycetota bacterium]|jgi:hypothetical protein
METPLIGSLVVPSPTYRATMETGEGAAILLATLRGSGKLYYPGTDQTFWVPMREVRGIPNEAVPGDSLELFLSHLLRLLETEECTVDRVGEGSMTLALDIPALSQDRLGELHDLVGECLVNYALEPRSMRALQLELQLVSLPRAAGAGD